MSYLDPHPTARFAVTGRTEAGEWLAVCYEGQTLAEASELARELGLTAFAIDTLRHSPASLEERDEYYRDEYGTFDAHEPD